ncbi:MAG TPA: pit accessory protein [Rhodanobacteraceae bacterium]|nr:pit accessory protein [Rhodanobacteraceae bacterium]
MFSLQTIFGSGDKFYGLLEASADTACESATALVRMLTDRTTAPALDAFAVAHQREKDLAAQISEELVDTFVTALDREDIEALSSALYKVPKTVQKFAERYIMLGDRLGSINFLPRAELIQRATTVMKEMVVELRNGMNISRVRKLQERLQAIESEADRLLLEPYGALYLDNSDPLRAVLAKDLYEVLEKAVDTCRDVGNVVYEIVLKNS